jgi:transcriptional regulator with XRE-family HTH domain
MKEDLLIRFGNKIRQERLKQNLSQEAFADKIGIHRTYIGMIERAEKNITLLNIKKLADGLGISISELMKLQ